MTTTDTRDSTPILGFWIYLMTDCILFASLFAVYAVMHGSTFGGPAAKDIFDYRYVLIETMLLLTSSFATGLALYSAHRDDRRGTLGWLAVTGILGIAFVTMEFSEFHHLVQIGDSWARSGFLSAYFTLVGTHGLHISVGIIWLVVLVAQLSQRGLDPRSMKRLTLFSLFWHFLDLIWIFIFSLVYLVGGAIS